MMALSVVIIAGLIGAGALGFEVVYDLTHSEIGRGLVAGLSITLLAIVLDRLTQAMGMNGGDTRGPVARGDRRHAPSMAPTSNEGKIDSEGGRMTDPTQVGDRRLGAGDGHARHGVQRREQRRQLG